MIQPALATSSRVGTTGGNTTETDLNEVLPLWGQDQNSDTALESPWARKVVLCLDGGGVRGYASLLILEAIMAQVKSLEKEQIQAPSSGAPHFRSASSAAYSWFNRSHAPYLPWNEGEYRPHQYFDYFFGTSTGGLSAMMLGRLRMDVDEAKSKYSIVGNEVFAHPRRLTGWKMLAPRFKSDNMERALQLITAVHRKYELGPNKSSSGLDLNHEEERGQKKLSANQLEEVKRIAKEMRLRDRHKNAARTVVVAHGGKESKEPLLFRSYDHPRPNDLPTTGNAGAGERYKEKHWRHFDACNLPLWKVGRATSAAPGYFSSMEIGKENIRDGALSGHNNPIKLAYDEVKQMHGPMEPALIISIGTGIKGEEKDSSRAPMTAIPFKHNILEMDRARRVVQNAVLDSQKPHEEFLRTVDDINKAIDQQNAALPDGKRQQHLLYKRFNIPEDLELSKIKLGEWEGTKTNPGSSTTEKIRNMVDTYLSGEYVADQIFNCARELVRIRQQRQRTVRWESFALKSVYCCHISTCGGRSFEDRFQLRDHAVRAHGLVWKVPAKDHHGLTARQYTCFWDECNETQVTVFDKEAELLEHLRTTHNMQDPRVLSREEYEKWLTNGLVHSKPGPSRIESAKFLRGRTRTERQGHS